MQSVFLQAFGSVSSSGGLNSKPVETRPAPAVPKFDDHDLCGTEDGARRAYKMALAEDRPSPEHLAAAMEAMAVQGRVQTFKEQIRAGRI